MASWPPDLPKARRGEGWSVGMAGTAETTEPQHLRRRWWRGVLRGCLIGLLLALGMEAGRVLFGSNVHVVVPGQVYRSAQLSPHELKKLVQKYHLRTVVNLRGCCPGIDWYEAESRATHALDVSQEDICFSAGHLPSISEMRRLTEVLDESERPLVLHCKRGADRTGLAAAVFLLSQTETSLATAQRQLGLRYGHFALGRPAYLDEFLDLYTTWLREQGCEHSSTVFRHWVEEAYCPGACRSVVEPLDWPPSMPAGKPFGLRVRAHNTSLGPWHFRPGSNAGFHVGYHLWDEHGGPLKECTAGLFRAEVAPGQSIDVMLPFPVLTPGHYRVQVDTVEAQHCWFHNAGSEPLECELDVR
jgi:hypothetical protein